MAGATVFAPSARERIIEIARLALIDGGVLEVSLVEVLQRASANIALVSSYLGSR
jgi:hypothetical protein